jgi:hypothetical protein
MRQKHQDSSFPFPFPSIVYLKHTNLGDILKVSLYAAESPLGLVPMLYHIKYSKKDIFLQYLAFLILLSDIKNLIKSQSKNGLSLKGYWRIQFRR